MSSLGGIFTSLSNYISGFGTPGSSIDAQTAAINNVNTAVGGMYTSINDSKYQSIITDQERTKNILQSQAAYLASIDTKYANTTETERRAIQQNTSHKRRYARYNTIMITLTISLVICGALLVLKKWVPIPMVGQVCVAAIILVLTYDIIYITNSYLDIQKRDRTDFDKIDPDAAGLPSRGTLAAMQSAALANASANQTTCTGQACCTVATNWNATLGKCT
jgi:hypothetical protein